MAVVVAWRGASELLERRRELMATGELATRLGVRRRRQVARALVAGGVDPRVHASVHVGRIAESDVDDVGLLEAAMRRATAGAALRAVRDAPGEPGGGQALLGAPLALAGAVTTAVALVRPLADGSPFL
ncbi:MAG: hypothetical protein JWM98_351, partial [Thermoleophilia bacterium]|nr:hypothetical protein [Thermoleophilia bacterium]